MKEHERIEWTHTGTGEHFVTETGKNAYTNEPIAVTHQVYPDQKVIYPHVVAKDTSLPEIPAPRMPAVLVPVHDVTIPRMAKSAANKAIASGWGTRVTKAIGPRIDAGGRLTESDSYTVAVRCDRPGQRVILTWRWHAATEKAASRWSFDVGYIMPPTAQVSSSEALRALDDFDGVYDLVRSRAGQSTK